MTKTGRATDRGGNEGLGSAVNAAAIEQLERNELLDLWSKVMGEITPRSMSQNMIRRFLAYEVQAQAVGGLGKAAVSCSELGGVRFSSGAGSSAVATALMPALEGASALAEAGALGFCWAEGLACWVTGL